MLVVKLVQNYFIKYRERFCLNNKSLTKIFRSFSANLKFNLGIVRLKKQDTRFLSHWLQIIF